MKIQLPLGAALLGLALSSTASAQNFTECGTVVSGVTCSKLFQADSGGLYLLDAPLGAVAVGDRIEVTGDLDPFCFSICLQLDGCIWSSSYVPGVCDVNPIGTPYCSPGQANSTGLPGTIEASGSDVAADDDLTLTANDLPNGQFAYFLCSQTQGFNPFPNGSQGILCLTGNIGRFNAQVGQVVGGSYSIDVDTTALPVNPVAPVLPGSTWNFQCWHRDVNPGQTSNFTDAVSITFS